MYTFFVLVLLGNNDFRPNRDTMVIRNASVFDTASSKMVGGQTIVIRGGRIDAISNSSNLQGIGDVVVDVDAAGKFVLPGLIDAHVHLVHLADRTHVTGDEFLPLFLAAGVTSVRSAGDAIVAAAGVAHYAHLHPEFCPRVFLASPLIDRDPPFHRDVGHALTDPVAVADFVADMVKWQVTTLKIYVGTSREIGMEVIKQGHRHGLKVTGHLGNYAAQDAAVDGIDCLEHIWSVFNYSIPSEIAAQPNHRATLDLNNPRCQSLIAQLAENKIAVDPTLVVFRNMIYLNDRKEYHDHPDVATVPQRMRDYWESYRANNGASPETLTVRRLEIRKYQELTGMLHRLGVPLLAGTDAPEPFVPPGLSLHQELEMLVESGLTPGEAILAATIINAKILSKHEDIGSIEKGKWADLIILDADPLVDIRNTRKIDSVIHHGWLAKPDMIRERVPKD